MDVRTADRLARWRFYDSVLVRKTSQELREWVDRPRCRSRIHTTDGMESNRQVEPKEAWEPFLLAWS